MNRHTKFGQQIDRLAISGIATYLEQAAGVWDVMKQTQQPLSYPMPIDLDIMAQDQAAAYDFELDQTPASLQTMVQAGDFDEDQRTRRDYLVSTQGHKRRLISALSQLYIEATHL